MKAYVIATGTVKDEAKFGEYRQHVPATVEPFGGKFVVRGGQVEVVEGTWSTPRLVMIEFPSRDHARRWYHSAAYQAIIQMRFDAAETDFLLIVDGVG